MSQKRFGLIHSEELSIPYKTKQSAKQQNMSQKRIGLMHSEEFSIPCKKTTTAKQPNMSQKQIGSTHSEEVSIPCKKHKTAKQTQMAHLSCPFLAKKRQAKQPPAKRRESSSTGKARKWREDAACRVVRVRNSPAGCGEARQPGALLLPGGRIPGAKPERPFFPAVKGLRAWGLTGWLLVVLKHHPPPPPQIYIHK